MKNLHEFMIDNGISPGEPVFFSHLAQLLEHDVTDKSHPGARRGPGRPADDPTVAAPKTAAPAAKKTAAKKRR